MNGDAAAVVDTLYADKRRKLLSCFALVLSIDAAWCFTMFWTRRPAIDYFCVLALTPLVLGGSWLVLGLHLLSLANRRGRRKSLSLGVFGVVALGLAPYTVLRAGADMFTLSVRYSLWREGGGDVVRKAFNKWVASLPQPMPHADQKFLFSRVVGHEVTPLPLDQLPPIVRSIHCQFPSRFGMTWKDVADIDDVSVFTTTDIYIGPPGWRPESPETLFTSLIGSRHRLSDGIWVELGTYDK